MPYPVPTGSFMSVIFEGRHENQQVMTTFMFRAAIFASPYPDGNDALDQTITAITAGGGLYSRWRDCISEDVSGIKIRAQWVRATRYRSLTRIPAAASGAVNAPALPTNSAVCVTRTGNVATRSNVGTLHLPGVPTVFVANSLVVPAALAAYASFGAESIQTITVGGGLMTLTPILTSRNAGLVSKDITGFSVSEVVRIMHRRTVGLGS